MRLALAALAVLGTPLLPAAAQTVDATDRPVAAPPGAAASRHGETGLFLGLRVDPAAPPPGSAVGRAHAFVGESYVLAVYGSPFRRGRQIFGGLLAYGQVWTPGAHYATEVALSGPVLVGEERLEPGIYSLFVTPAEGAWTVHVNRALGTHQTDGYDPSQNVLSLRVPTDALAEPVEQLTIDFAARDAARVELRIAWDRARARVPLRAVPAE
ncbi:MAG: DUF2911 domain-containing protein [Rubricoccaceae bacterium]